MNKFSLALICILIWVTEQGVPNKYVLDCSYKGSTIQLTIELSNNFERHCFCLPLMTENNDDLTINKDNYCSSKICKEECHEVDFVFICKNPLCFCYDVKNPDQSEAYFKFAKIKKMANACPTLLDTCESQNACVSDDNQQCDLADQKCICKSGYKNLYGECSDNYCYSDYDKEQCRWPDDCQGPIKCEHDQLHVKMELLFDGKKYTVEPTMTTLQANVTSSPVSPSKLQWWAYLLIVLAILSVIGLIIFLVYKFKFFNKIERANDFVVEQDRKIEKNNISMKNVEVPVDQRSSMNRPRYTQDPTIIEAPKIIEMHAKLSDIPKINEESLKEESDEDDGSEYEKIEEVDFFVNVPKNVAKRNMLERIDLDSNDPTNRIITKYFKSSLLNSGDFLIVQCDKITKREDEEVHLQNGFYDDPNSYMLWYIASMNDIERIFQSGIADPIYQNGLDTTNKTVFYDRLHNLRDKTNQDGYSLLLLCRVSMGNM